MTPAELQGIEDFRANAYPVIDDWCRSAIEKFGTGCREGCALCCRNVTTMSLLEAAVILNSEAGRAIFDQKLSRIVDLSDLFIRRDPSTRLLPWRERNEECVFLGFDERCLIYDVRPFSCRTHLAAKPCTAGTGANLYIDHLPGVIAAMRLLDVGEERTGIPSALAPVPVALLLAADIMRHGMDDAMSRLGGTPFLDPLESATFWSYIEL
jgi:Fe-S-cluster containining protein